MAHLLLRFLIVVALLSGWREISWGVPIAIVNPSGEAYADDPAGPTSPNVEINPGGVPPLAENGWNSTQAFHALAAVEAIGNNSNSGSYRLAFGAMTDGSGDAEASPEEVLLFQETSHVAAAGDRYQLDYFGRGFFRFSNGVDFQTSFFGYLDDLGNVVQVDAKPQPSVVSGAWNAASHSFTVPPGSPLIGENLVIGFFTASGDFAVGTANVGAFSSIDDVSLQLVPEPSTMALGAIHLGQLIARRRSRRP